LGLADRAEIIDIIGEIRQPFLGALEVLERIAELALVDFGDSEHKQRESAILLAAVELRIAKDSSTGPRVGSFAVRRRDGVQRLGAGCSATEQPQGGTK